MSFHQPLRGHSESHVRNAPCNSFLSCSALIDERPQCIVSSTFVSFLKMKRLSATVGQICSWFACLCTAVNALATIPPSQTLSTTFTNAQLLNTTLLGTDIDTHFGIVANYAETNIPVTPCLMNIVELLANYAELDWLGRVRQRHGVVLPSYPQVEFAVIPSAPATSVEVRFVVWGLWVGIRDIVSQNRFVEVEFELYWEEQVVAYIYITRPMDLGPSSSNETLGTDGPLTLSPPSNGTASVTLDDPNSTTNLSDTLTDERFSWSPRFGYDAKTLTIFEVFLTVIAGLKNAAPMAALDKVTSAYASAAVNVDANLQIFLHKRRTPRPRPPYLQYIHVIKALRLVPGYMLAEGRFAELIFVMQVNNLPVGEGYLASGPYVPPHPVVLGDMLASKDNVSLS